MHFGGENGSFLAFGARNNDRFLKPFEVKMHIPSHCLDASENGPLLELIA